MAATPNPIVWDFYRQVSETSKLGVLAHYYDASAQDIYLNSGVKTKTTAVVDGHWKDSVYSTEILLNSDEYSSMSGDSTTNKEIHISALLNQNLYYLRYNGEVLISVDDFLNL